MNKKQQERARGKLQSDLNAASIYTQQPGIQEEATTERNNTVTEDRNNALQPSVNNTITEVTNNDSVAERNNGITEDVNNSSKRGPKKKGEFKKVTLNLDVDLNTALDKYILSLKQQALENGGESPNKSEWVRELVEDKLRDLGIME